MKQLFINLKTNLEAYFSSEQGKMTAKVFKYTIQALVIGILVWQLWNIGLVSVIQDFPVHPLFYLLFLLIYFSLPVSEFFTYKRHVPLKFLDSQSIFIKKRIYNKTVVGYSGELQLFFWLKKHHDIPEKQAFRIVRDNNTLSTIASTFVTVTLLAGFILSGNITLLENLNINVIGYLGGIAIVVLVLVLLLRRYKEYLYSMNRRDTLSILGIHSIRLYLLAFLQILQWAVVMPEVEVHIWVTIISMQIVLSRLPFIPNKDLLFIAASLEYGQHADISATGLAALLVVNHVLDKLLNGALFAWLSFQDKKSGIPLEESDK
jgi:hypothetical protein